MQGNSIVEEKEPNFSNLAHILGPLPKAWPGGAACSVDRSGEEDYHNRPFSGTHCSAFLMGSASPP